MKKVLIALFIVLAAFVTIACKQPEPEPVDPGHVHEMTAVGTIYKCSGCGNFYEDEAGTKKLATISSMAELRALCASGGKAVLTADILAEDTETSGAYSNQQAAVNVAADIAVTLFDDGTARSIKRTEGSAGSKNQFFEVNNGASFTVTASAAGKIIFDGNGTTVSGNGWFIRVNSGASVALTNVKIKDVKNSGTGSTVRLDHKTAAVSFSMTGCSVEGCQTSSGNGGFLTDTAEEFGSTINLKNCTFTGNSCVNTKDGSVLFFTGSNNDITLDTCAFIANTSSNNAPLATKKGFVQQLTLKGINVVGQTVEGATQYPAAAKTSFGNSTAIQYWPAAT